MGAVYLAEHAVLGRKAAIKVLLPEFSNNAGLVARFLNEARATAQLRHPAFVEIFDSGTLPDGSAYLVMEYLEGEDLGQRIRRTGPMPLGDCLLVARAVADGAGFAHRHHIIHRDLKPDNIFLTPAGQGADATGIAIKVLDFGIAKLAEPGGGRSSSRTGTGVLLGTPLFMSPEQCRGAGQVDHRSDIYSLGCIIYTMLVGTPPFFLEGFGEIIAAHLGQPPPRLRDARPDLPAPVEELVASMLAKSAANRPPDMDRVVAEIDALRTALRLPATLSVALPPAGRTGEVRPRTIAATTPLPPSLASPAIGSNAGATRRLAQSDLDSPSRKGSGSVSTLAGAAGAFGDTDRVSRAARRRGGLIAAGALIVVAAVGGVFASRWNGARIPDAEVGRAAPTEPEPPPTPARRAEADPTPRIAGEEPARAAGRPAAPIAPPGSVAERAPVVAAVPSDVVLRIVSTPAGAELSDGATGDVLGQTPFEGRFARDRKLLTVRLRKAGYRNKDLQLTLDQDRDLKVVLRKSAGEKPAAPSDDLRKL